MALAHRLDELVRSGTAKNYRELASLGLVSPARLSQILTLLNLAPPIQEYILFLSDGEGRFVTENQLRSLARDPYWDRQTKRFDRCMGARTLLRRPEPTVKDDAGNG
jgi:hypothetical protein